MEGNMKIKQTIISAIFGCCLTFSILFAGCSLFSDNASDLFEFNLKVGDTYYIKSIKSDDITELEIPESYNNKKISGIENNAFANCSSLKKVVIPEGVTEIGANAFNNCSALETISLPSSISKIGTDAFSGCSSLKYYTFENGAYLGNEENNYLVLLKGLDKSVQSFQVNEDCKIIYTKALYSFTNLYDLEMPYSIYDIGSRAFGGCSSLKEFLVPNMITDFTLGWFENCTSLKTITISANVETVAISYFMTCQNLSEFKVYSTNPKFAAKDGVLYSKDLKTLLSYPVGKTQSSFEIPSYVECLATYAFDGCENLKSLIMYPYCKTLRSAAVINCNNLHTLNFRGTTSEWLEIDNGNPGWDHSFVINKVNCTNGSFNRGKA